MSLCCLFYSNVATGTVYPAYKTYNAVASTLHMIRSFCWLMIHHSVAVSAVHPATRPAKEARAPPPSLTWCCLPSLQALQICLEAVPSPADIQMCISECLLLYSVATAAVHPAYQTHKAVRYDPAFLLAACFLLQCCHCCCAPGLQDLPRSSLIHPHDTVFLLAASLLQCCH